MAHSTSILWPEAQAPTAQRRAYTHQYGERTISDSYAWLRADNWRDVMRDPANLPDDIRQHLLAENDFCDAALADTLDLQKTLVGEMRGRMSEVETDVPMEDGTYAYFEHYREGEEHSVYARQLVGKDKLLSGTDGAIAGQDILDVNALAKDHEYFDLGMVTHSPDHTHLAYSSDCQGSEYYDIRFKNLDTGALLPDQLHSASADIVWSADGQRLYWIWRDDNNRPREVRCHQIGKPHAESTLVYREEDEGFFLSLGQTSDRKFLIIQSNDHTTSEVRVLDTSTANPMPMLIAPRQPGLEYEIDHAGKQFYILTNADNAEDFKIVTAPDHAPERANWRDWIAPAIGVRRLEQRLFRDFHVRIERKNALARIIIRELKSNTEHEISFDGAAYALGLCPLLDFDTMRLRFVTSSPAQPQQVFDYHMGSKERTLRKTQEVPSGHDPSHYCVERIMAEAPDGEQVPISLVYHKDTKRDGSAPLLLYGYGAYGITIPAGFSSRRLSLIDRGFVYAIAHVRGGEAKGHAWYTAAKGINKPNTFHDFIAAAEALIAGQYTAKGRIIAMGGSAGGLLVGAVVNMAPELFGGIIAAVPFVDVLNTMCDESLPLTPPEWPEWGNPLLDATAFESIRGYSPYDNVTNAPYPPLLATAGLTDPRVTYWEPAKWVAQLRHRAPQAGPYLLKTEMQAGHAGASGRFEGLKMAALEYAFAVKTAALQLQ